ncbi:MAG: hypothetical protein OQK24_10490, partial [Magnetovibrio sp.]|nr:hypothetical protein [Magnetovibrio sp.]
MSDLSDAKNALKAAETALEDAIQRQSLMEKQHYQSVAEIVHDIKNPLTAMMGYISLLKNEAAGPINNPAYEGFIRTLDKSTIRLLDTCNSLLEEYASDVEKADKP